MVWVGEAEAEGGECEDKCLLALHSDRRIERRDYGESRML